jgi:predicted NUDIX family NTP pyrophosphohydrolase
MAKKISSGILFYRTFNNVLEVFLVHPGGPIFKNKDDGHWGIPKGEVEEGEDLLTAAIRETKEETGIDVSNNLIPLGSIKQKGGKTVHGWAAPYLSLEEPIIKSNMIKMQWPPVWGRTISFPEVDKGSFFSVEEAKRKIKPTQIDLIDRLIEFLNNKK